MWKPLTLATALALALGGSGLAQAQNAAPAAPAASSSAAKKELVTKVLKLQQPGIEAMARQLAEQPARQLLQQADMALQRVPADRREALARDIEADARKYVDEASPIVRDKAIKLAPATIGPILEERFTEDELKQIIAILESPVNRRFQQAGPEMQKAIGEKLVAESRGEVEAKVRALDQSVSNRLRAAVPAGAASGAATPGAKAASAPSKAKK